MTYALYNHANNAMTSCRGGDSTRKVGGGGGEGSNPTICPRQLVAGEAGLNQRRH